MTAAPTVTGWLTADHRRLHELFEQARRGPLDAEAFAAFRAGLLRHVAIEEKVLFPAVAEARGGEVLPRARALRVDHAAMASLLVPTPDLALCAELASLLAPHEAAEEGPDGVYAECEQLLGEVRSAALAERARDYPEVRVSPYYDGPRAHRTAAAALEAARRRASR